MFKSKAPYEKKAEIVREYLERRVGYTESLKRILHDKPLELRHGLRTAFCQTTPTEYNDTLHKR